MNLVGCCVVCKFLSPLCSNLWDVTDSISLSRNFSRSVCYDVTVLDYGSKSLISLLIRILSL